MALHALAGVSPQAVDDALRDADLKTEARGYVNYAGAVILANPNPGTPGHVAIDFAGMPDWLRDSWTVFGQPVFLAKPVLIAMGMWAAIGGGNMILYLAALTSVPPELHEAAAIDGAGPWRRFRDVTWSVPASAHRSSV